MLIQFIITVQSKTDWWRFWQSGTPSILQQVRKNLPKRAEDLVLELPQDFTSRDYYAGRVLTSYRSTYLEADIWWINGYPEGEGSFIVVIQPQTEDDRVPSRVDELTLKLFGEIESRIPGGLCITANRLEYKRVAHVFTVTDNRAPFLVPETGAFFLVSSIFGIWLAVERYVPTIRANQILYGYIFALLTGVLSSAFLSVLVALMSWTLRKRREKRGRRVVYQDGK